MAIIGGVQDDDEENTPKPSVSAGRPSSTGTNPLAPTTSSSPNAHAGSGGGFVGGSGTGSGQGATTGVAPAAGGSGYTNLAQYLSANQASGATTAKGAENVIEQAGSDAQKAQDAYGQSAQNQISGGVTTSGDQQVYGGPLNTGAFTGDTSKLQQEALGKTDIANSWSKQANNGQAGRQALLSQAYQQPQYSQGEKNLDSFLVGGLQSGQQYMNQGANVGLGLTGAYQKLNDKLTGNIADTQKGVNDANTATEAAKKAAATPSAPPAATTTSLTGGSTGTTDTGTGGTGISDTHLEPGTGSEATGDADLSGGIVEDFTSPTNTTTTTETETGGGGGGTGTDPTIPPVVTVPLVENTGNAVKTAVTTPKDPTIKTGAVKWAETLAKRLANQQHVEAEAAKKAAAKTGSIGSNAQTTSVTPSNLNAIPLVNKAVGAIKNQVSKLPKVKLSHGGEVPSYAKLSSMLKRGKR